MQSLTPRTCPAPLAGVHVGVVAHWSQVDGDWRFDSRRSALIWSIDLIDNTNRSGSLEFVVPACDPEVFYPVEVRRGGGTCVHCVCWWGRGASGAFSAQGSRADTACWKGDSRQCCCVECLVCTSDDDCVWACVSAACRSSSAAPTYSATSPSSLSATRKTGSRSSMA